MINYFRVKLYIFQRGFITAMLTGLSVWWYAQYYLEVAEVCATAGATSRTQICFDIRTQGIQ